MENQNQDQPHQASQNTTDLKPIKTSNYQIIADSTQQQAKQQLKIINKQPTIDKLQLQRTIGFFDSKDKKHLAVIIDSINGRGFTYRQAINPGKQQILTINGIKVLVLAQQKIDIDDFQLGRNKQLFITFKIIKNQSKKQLYQMYLYDQPISSQQIYASLSLVNQEIVVKQVSIDQVDGISEIDQIVKSKQKLSQQSLLLTLSNSLKHVTLCGIGINQFSFQLIRTKYRLNTHNYFSLIKSPHPFYLRQDFNYKLLIDQLVLGLENINKKANPQFSYWMSFIICQAIQYNPKPTKSIFEMLKKYKSIIFNMKGTSLESIFDELCGQFLIECKEINEQFNIKEIGMIGSIFQLNHPQTKPISRLNQIRSFFYNNRIDNITVLKILRHDDKILQQDLLPQQIYFLADIIHKFVIPQTKFHLQKKDLPQNLLNYFQYFQHQQIIFKHRYHDLMLTKPYKKLVSKLIGKALYWIEKEPDQVAARLLMQSVIRYSNLYQQDLTELAQKSIPAKVFELYSKECSLCKQYIQKRTNLPISKINQLQRPFMQRIRIKLQAGGKQVLFIQNIRPMSLLLLAYQCKSHDIDFKISWIGDINYFFSNYGSKKQLVSINRMKFGNRALILAKQGLYAFQIDNSFSYLRQKIVDLQYSILQTQIQPSPIYRRLQRLMKRVHRFKHAVLSIEKQIVSTQLAKEGKIIFIQKKDINQCIAQTLEAIGQDQLIIVLKVFSIQGKYDILKEIKNSFKQKLRIQIINSQNQYQFTIKRLKSN